MRILNDRASQRGRSGVTEIFGIPHRSRPAENSNKGRVNKSPAPIFAMFSYIILLAIRKIGAGRLRRWTLQAFPLPRYAPAGWFLRLNFKYTVTDTPGIVYDN
jgi:hypothetical protein